MANKYIIAITGKQYTEGNLDDEDCIDVLTVGSYEKKDNKRYIIYKEYSDDTPPQTTNSMIKIENNRVTISRSGLSKYKLILEKGARHKCEYSNEAGFFFLGVYTENIENKLTDSGGTLSISYSLDIDSNLISRNEINIIIKEATK